MAGVLLLGVGAADVTLQRSIIDGGEIDERVMRAVQVQLEGEGGSGAQLSRDLSLRRRVSRSYPLPVRAQGIRVRRCR